MADSDSRSEKSHPNDAPTTNHPRRGMRRLTAVLLVVVCIAIGGYWAWVASQIVHRGKRKQGIEANLPPSTLQQISTLDQKSFQNSLPRLRQILEDLGQQTETDQRTLMIIAGKLQETDESAPDYWPTARQFVESVSSKMAPNTPPSGERPRALSDILSVGIMRGVREDHKTILFDDGDLGNARFTNCRIIFSQNPVRMSNVVFEGCVFELPTADPPSPYLRKLIRQLLAQPESVTINSL